MFKLFPVMTPVPNVCQRMNVADDFEMKRVTKVKCHCTNQSLRAESAVCNNCGGEGYTYKREARL